jgi:predicted DNA-binding protein (MmcQ/YjbR family)
MVRRYSQKLFVPLMFIKIYVMNIELLRNYCIAKKGVEETFPFDNDTLVFKVMEKMFALTSLNEPVSVNLKCDPEYAISLREQYDAIQPGWHMSKTHWNTVSFLGNLDDKFILELVDHSYDQVVKGLTKKLRAELESL